ncbi:MAG: PAS domain S-box protein [Verrucomicrobia bacterium]|nr:PAS domain S-box protein [Verrucomicrobiota bacterium]
MTKPLHILIVEDSASDAGLVARHIEHAGYEVRWERVDTATDLRAALEREPWHVILCDYSMPDFSGTEALAIVRASGCDVPFIFVSGTMGEDAAVEAMRAGAHDYVVKGSLKRLVPAIQRELREAEGRRAHKRAEATLRLESAALAAAANAIIITDRNGTIEWANPAFTTLTGYTLAEAAGKDPRELVKSGQQERTVYQNLWETILAGRVWHGELINRRKDGSLYPEDQTITPVRDAVGEIAHFIAIKEDLTARKQAEAARRTSEEQYRSLFENMSEGLAVCQMLFDGDRPQNFVYLKVNHAFETLTGLKNVAGRKVTEIIPGIRESDPALFEIYGRVARGGAPEKFEIYLEALKMWFAISTYGSGQGQFVAVFDVITARKRTQEEIAKWKNRYEATVKASGLLLYDWDPATNAVTWGGDSERILGYSQDELGHDLASWLELIHPDDRPAFNQELERTVADRKPFHLQYRVRRRDASHIVAQDDGYFVLDAQDQLMRMVGFVADITVQTRAEEALRGAEQKYRAIFDHAVEGIAQTTPEGQFISANPAMARIFGFDSPEELMRERTDIAQQIYVNPARREEFKRLMEENDNVSGFEYEVQRRDGSVIWLSASARAVRGEDGRVAYYESTMLDITERKTVEQQFLRAQRMESLGRLAGGIAHDFNNILAPIMMSAPLLRMGSSAADTERTLATIEQSAQRGADLVKQLLLFGRGIQGARAAMRLKDSVRELEDMVGETFPKNIELIADLPRDLWLVQADGTQLHQVLMNLCVNAHDAMPDGGTLTISAANLRLNEIEARLHVDAKPGAYVALRVSDTGTGIAPDALDHIFDPFFTTKTPGKGTGLGLSTVLGIVKSHGGFVTVQSAPGRGCTFAVHLPALLEGSDLVPAADALPPAGGHGEEVLVVDDEALIRGSIEKALTKHGYTVFTAGNGIEGAAIYVQRAQSIKLVVTDLSMPQMDGTTMIQLIRRLNPALPIVVATGLSGGEDWEKRVAQLEGLGAKVALAKPFTVDRILHAVHEALTAPA